MIKPPPHLSHIIQECDSSLAGSREPGSESGLFKFYAARGRRIESSYLTRFLRLSIVHEATDPREKVYALFGLLGVNVEHFYRTEYEINTAKLFQIVA
jgi:hypothetical protein